jgi:hypothetical protein
VEPAITIYKVLYLDEEREKALSGVVRADDGEKWDSLVEALQDLSSVGFEVHTPIYGPAPKVAGGGQVIEAFLLASTSATQPSDLERRIKRTKTLVAEAEAHLATLASDMERPLQGQRVRELCAELQEVEQRLRRTRKGAEPTDVPASVGAVERARSAEQHAISLAKEAEEAFSRNDFDTALAKLRELQKAAGLKHE